jgi:PKD domain-containing protein
MRFGAYGDGARDTMTGRGRSLKRRPGWVAVGLGLLMVSAGCGLDKVDTPALNGPSETGFSMRLSLSKDILVADGRDFAVVTAAVIGPDGRPAQNQDVFFAIADANGNPGDIGVIVGSNGPGTGATVRTNAQGIAQILYEAPARTDATANTSVLITARLVSFDSNGRIFNTVRVDLRSAEPRLFPNPDPNGTAPLTCNFITEPAAGPFKAGQVIGFHSTSSGAIIRYEWNFGDNTTGDAPDEAHVYPKGTFTVTHTVTDSLGRQAKCAAVALQVQ